MKMKWRWVRGILSFFLILFLPVLQTVSFSVSDESPTSSEENSPPSYVPGRLIVKLNPQASLTERNEAGSRLEQLSARWGVSQKEPLLFKNFLPVWERRMKASGPTTQPRTSWYWYLDEKDWMPKPPKDPQESVQPAGEVRAQQEAAAALEQYHFQNVLLLNLPKEADVPAVAKAFAADPAVEYAHPDYVMKAQFVPNDPYYASSGAWGQSFRDLWGLEKIEAEKAWDSTQGQGVVVAVSDTGIDYNHPDIATNVWTNPGEIPGNGIDDDGNGFVDDWRGWNFVAGNNDPMDDHGHGTHVAGTIAAVGNNRIGIIGVAPQAKVMAVKGLDANGSGALSDLASGILYAANNGAKVINASWGGFGETPALLQEVISFAHDVRDVVFVAAAGNSTTDVGNPEEGFFPANIREVVTVSAFDHLDQKAPFSNFGVKIDVAAPGGGDADPAETDPPSKFPVRSILSLKASGAVQAMLDGHYRDGNGVLITVPNALVVGGSYLRQAGTSMAAPHVSGAAALVRALHPEFSAEQVRQALRSGSDDTGAPGFDPLSGYGRLNVKGALAQDNPFVVWLPALPKQIFTASDTVEISGTVQGPSLTLWTLQFGSGTIPDQWTTIAQGTTPAVKSLLTRWDTRMIRDGTYTMRLLAQNASGSTFENRVSLTIDRVLLTDPPPAPVMTPFRGGQVTIRGTARPAGFQSYSIQIFKSSDGTLLSPAAITLTNRGLQPVTDGVLGAWNTAGVPAGHYRLQLRVRLMDGSDFVEEARLMVDPTLHEGWPKNIRPTGGCGRSVYPNAVDVNGDGKADLAINYGELASIFDHTGALLPGWPQPVVSDVTHTGLAVGDIDGDGTLEVVGGATHPFLPRLNQMFVWKSNGQLMTGWPRAPGIEYFDYTIADMDGNGTHEIIVTGTDGFVTVMDKNGAPLPGWPKVLNRAVITSAAVGDVDGDGKKEIAVANRNGPNNLYLLGSAGQVMPGWPKAINPTASNTDDSSFTSPVLGDLDGDGDLEVVMGSGDGKVYAFHPNGTPVSGWPQLTIPTGVNSVVIGDIDGEGSPEVIASNQRYTDATGQEGDYLYAWHGDGSLLPGWPVVLSGPFERSLFGFSNPALADVDGDGKADVIVSSDVVAAAAPMPLHAYRYDGRESPGFPKPTLALSTESEIELEFGDPSRNSAAIADLDGDGFLELAWGDTDGNLYVWDLVAPATSPAPWPMFAHDPQHTGALVIPRIPTSLLAKPVSSTQINLTWTDNANNETGFKIYAHKTGQSFSELATVRPNVTSYSHTGLTEDTRYFYKVLAYNKAGNSAYSNFTYATTLKKLPRRPSFLSVGRVTGSTIKLTWHDNANNEEGFRVYRSTNNVTFTQIAHVSANLITYTNTSLSRHTTYYYKITAYNNGGESDFAGPVSGTTR